MIDSHKMQTYYRNKQGKAAAADAGTTSETLIECSQIPFVGEHSLHTTDCHSPCNNGLEHIQIGYFYQLNHQNLPRRSPIYLKSIRVVMVTEKTEYNVAVKFPSSSSLRTYFRRVFRNEKNKEKNQTVSVIPPKLDEQFVMGSKPAREVLTRKILPSEFSEQKKLESFWLVEPPNKSNETAIPSSTSSSMDNNERPSAGGCGSSIKGMGLGLSAALNSSGLMRWGVRRRVTFVGRHKEMKNSNPEPGVDDDESLPLMDQVIKSEDEDEASEEAGEGIVEQETTERRMRTRKGEEILEQETTERRTRTGKGEGILEQESTERRMRTRKRTREISMHSRKKAKTTNIKEKKLKGKRRKKNKNKKVSTGASIKKNIIASAGKSIKKNIIAGDGVQRKEKLSYDRWSKVRYKTAEGKMLDILKETKAVFGKPILRRDLRIQARQHIGDTGLLDHLLKHMAGKVAPNGEDRFRRRHNSEGEMEYWLESADLVNVRKEAGVNDPYWTPPPGWQLGDNPSQDPICAKELKMLRDEMAELKRNMEELVVLRSSMSCMTKEAAVAGSLEDQGNVTHDQQQPAALMSSSSNNLSPTEAAVAVVSPLKGVYESLVKRKAQLEQQLVEISVSLNKMQEEVGKITSTGVVVEETTKSSVLVEAAAAGGTEATADKEEEGKRRGSSLVVLKREAGDLILSEDEGGREDEAEKAARRQRLRSGFRICKPQGTFLWPNMVGGGGTTPGSSSTAAAAGAGCSNNILALSPHQHGGGGGHRHHQHQHPQVMVQVQEDLNMVPTPSSVNSSSSAASHCLQLLTTAGRRPTSPLMKPLAERRAVTVTVMVPDLNSDADDVTAYESEDNKNNISTTTTTRSTTTTTTSYLQYHGHGHGPHAHHHHHHHHHGKATTNNNSNSRKEFYGTTTTTPTSSLSADQAFVLPPSHQQQQVWGREEKQVVQSEATTAAPRSSIELAQYHRKQHQHQQLLQQHIDMGLGMGLYGQGYMNGTA